MFKKKKIETLFGTLYYDKEYEQFNMELPPPIFKDNTCSIDYPFSLSNIQFDSLNSSYKEKEHYLEKVSVTANCIDSRRILSEKQIETIHFVYDNLNNIESVVLGLLSRLRERYLDQLFNKQNISHLELDIEKSRAALEDFLSNRQIEVRSFSLSAITILCFGEYEGCFALDFRSCWDLEGGFALLFKDLEVKGIGNIYDYFEQ